MWMLKIDSSSVLLLQQLLIFHDDTSKWFDKHTFRIWSQLQFCIFGIFFSTVPFHLVFVVTSKIKLIPCYCSHFEWPGIRHAGVSWPSWKVIRFWSSSVDFPHFGGILTLWNRPNLRFPGTFLRTKGRNCIKIGMLMYSDHLQNTWDFGHGMLIFLILASFWLSETGQIWDFRDFL